MKKGGGSARLPLDKAPTCCGSLCLMRSHNHLVGAVFFCAVVMSLICCRAAVARQTDFSDDDLGVSLRIPDGWKAIPAKTLEKSAHQKDLGDSGAVLAGYCRGGTALTPPYMVIDGWAPPFEYTRASWNDIIKHMQLITIDQARTQGLLDGNGKYTGTDLSPPILDQDRKMIIMQGTLPRDPNSSKPGLYLVSASFLGKFDFVRVHAYLPADRVKTLLPEVQWTLDSVAFQQGAGFEPYKASARPSSYSSGGRYGRYGYLGGGGFVLVVLVRYLLSRWADD